MVGYIRDQFCSEEQYSPRFTMDSSNQPWRKQYRQAERIDPEPTDLKAFRKVHRDITHPGMPDFISDGCGPVVSEAFRRIVLELEPDRHQFVPIALYDEARQPLPGSYWLINVLQRPDCVIEPDQIMKWDAEGHPLPELQGYWVSKAPYIGHMNLTGRRADVDPSQRDQRRPTQKVVYLDRSRIEGLHLWRRFWRIPTFNDVKFGFFFSDELLLRVTQARLRKLTVHPVVEMSVPTGG